MIEKVKQAHELVTALYDENGVISVHPYDKKIHMETEAFFKEFSAGNSSVADKNDEAYPYEVSIEANGFTFFALLREEEFEKYVKGAGIKEVV